MPLRPFAYYQPTSLAEVFALIRTCEPDRFSLTGGGTDVLVKIKRRLSSPSVVINLRGVQELRKIERQGETVFIGAAATLREVKDSDLVRRFFPALAEAAGRVGSPQLRNMGTVGGNVCLDTRCLYYNQSSWPGAFPPCFKRGGDRCHVVKRGSRCYALFCADTPSVLLTLDARLSIVGFAGEREVSISQFYRDDGLCCHHLGQDEVITGIRIPVKQGTVSSYRRFSARGAIDFPVVGVAVSIEKTADGQYINPRIAATGLQSQPVRLNALEELLGGRDLARMAREGLGVLLEEGTKDMRLVRHQGITSSYRRRLLKVLVERALADCIAKEDG